MRSVFLIVAVLLAWLIAPTVASACSIAAPPPSHDPLEKPDIAVYGEVVSRTLVKEAENTPNAEYRYRFRVIKTYKGKPARTITLLAGTEESMCEAGLLSVGDRFGLLLFKNRGPFRIGLGSFISRADLERAKRRRG